MSLVKPYIILRDVGLARELCHKILINLVNKCKCKESISALQACTASKHQCVKNSNYFFFCKHCMVDAMIYVPISIGIGIIMCYFII